NWSMTATSGREARKSSSVARQSPASSISNPSVSRKVRKPKRTDSSSSTTNILDFTMPALLLGNNFDPGQSDRYNRPALRPIADRNFPSMLLHDALNDSQPQARPPFTQSEKRLKHAPQGIWAEAWSRVLEPAFVQAFSGSRLVVTSTATTPRGGEC